MEAASVETVPVVGWKGRSPAMGIPAPSKWVRLKPRMVGS